MQSCLRLLTGSDGGPSAVAAEPQNLCHHRFWMCARCIAVHILLHSKAESSKAAVSTSDAGFAT